MKKTLVAGLATIIIAGTALVGTGMYAAATTDTSGTTRTTTQANRGPGMGHGNPEDIVATLSGKVSTEALTALETLMAKHKSEMDEARSNTGTTIDKATMDAERAAFKTEMDALLVQFPELKTALPQMGEGKGRGNGEMETIMATLPASVQAEITAVRESFQVKQEALRTEEKNQISTILAAYPEVKAKLDAIEAKGPQGKEGRGHRGGNRDNDSTVTTTNTGK